MPAHRAPRPLLSLLALALAAAPQICESAAADGLPLGPLPGNAQCRPTVTSDGRGGALVTYKTSALEVGAVHVSGTGVTDGGLAFAPAAVPLALEADEPVRASLPSDSQVVLVCDRGTSTTPVFASLRAGGSASAGFPVGLAMSHRHPAVVAGRAGRTLIVSKNSDAITYWTLRAAIVDAKGQVAASIQISSPFQFFNADPLDAVTDGAGGLIAAFSYYNLLASDSKDIAVFRYAADGSRPWGDLPRPTVFAGGDQTEPRLAPDGAGGVLMAWTDARSPTGSTDIYGLHLDASALRAPGWQYYGQPICDAPGAQSQPRILSDGAGGAWVAWLDQRSGLEGDLRYSHVLADGQLAAGFTSSGTPLCVAAGAQGEVALAGDGAGGFFAVWRDNRSGDADIYSQHVTAAGEVASGWPVNGRAIAIAPGNQDQPAIASVTAGRAVVAWRDARAGATRIYGAAIVEPATTGVPSLATGGLRLVALGPVRYQVSVRLTLPTAEPAVLELLDVAGRVRARVEPAGPATDRAETLAPGRALEPGLYFARLRQGGAVACARATVLH